MSQKAAILAAPVDLDQIFWSSVQSIAAQAPADNKWPTFDSLASLYNSQYPDADRFEYRAAMARIAKLVGIPEAPAPS